MFTSILDTSLKIMTLGAADHNILNTMMLDEISAMMKRENWTCHVCKTRLYGMMEVDHLNGHAPSGKNAIAPICMICHHLKHPLWAASRGRMRVIHAPDLDYPEISRWTWSLLVHNGCPGFDINHRGLARDFNARREDARDAMGHDNPESIFEAILTLAKDEKNIKKLRAKLEERDRHMRIIPAVLLDENAGIDIWTKGGFQSPSEHWKDPVLKGGTTDYEALKRAGTALLARL